ncbi:MAG TPA: M20 family metallopeptidase [Acidimicrobiales bacterium]|nr:M20 family metallopeptidase [Acidimicrobiales bacterium]
MSQGSPGTRDSAQADAAKQAARQAIDERRSELVALARVLHDRPELGFEEHHAVAEVSRVLEGAGFHVESATCGLPTALRAWAGPGPLSLLFCAEYDALPGIGHACGHNLIAAAAVGAGVGLAAVAEQLELKVTVLGTPAEEGGGGKVLLLERGAFAGVHAAMMVHPWHEDRLGANCLAVDHVEVRFSGREAHASAAPHNGVNAADAMVLSQVAIGLLRQQLPAGQQVHGIVTKGGDAVNVIPKQTVGRFMIRAPTIEALATLRPRVERCFEAGALATGCSVEITDLCPRYSDYVADHRLLERWRVNAEALGRRFSADDAGAPLPTFSTDMGNVSRTVPAIHPLVGLDSGGAVIHEPAFADATVGPSAEQTAIDGALSMAFTAVDIATDSELRREMMER